MPLRNRSDRVHQGRAGCSTRARAQALESGEMKTVLAERSYRLAKCMTKVGDGARPIRRSVSTNDSGCCLLTAAGDRRLDRASVVAQGRSLTSGWMTKFLPTVSMRVVYQGELAANEVAKSIDGSLSAGDGETSAHS